MLALVFRNRPEEIGQLVDGESNADHADSGVVETSPFRDHSLREALRAWQYWIMVTASALPSMILTGIHFHTVQIYLDHGVQEFDAAAMFSTYAKSLSVVKLLGGVLAGSCC